MLHFATVLTKHKSSKPSMPSYIISNVADKNITSVAVTSNDLDNNCDIMTWFDLCPFRSSTRRCRGLECSTTGFPSRCPPRRCSTCGSAWMNTSTSSSSLTTNAHGEFCRLCHIVASLMQALKPYTRYIQVCGMETSISRLIPSSVTSLMSFLWMQMGRVQQVSAQFEIRNGPHAVFASPLSPPYSHSANSI